MKRSETRGLDKRGGTHMINNKISKKASKIIIEKHLFELGELYQRLLFQNYS